MFLVKKTCSKEGYPIFTQRMFAMSKTYLSNKGKCASKLFSSFIESFSVFFFFGKTKLANGT